jgi:hypothetical protein
LLRLSTGTLLNHLLHLLLLLHPFARKTDIGFLFPLFFGIAAPFLPWTSPGDFRTVPSRRSSGRAIVDPRILGFPCRALLGRRVVATAFSRRFFRLQLGTDRGSFRLTQHPSCPIRPDETGFQGPGRKWHSVARICARLDGEFPSQGAAELAPVETITVPFLSIDWLVASGSPIACARQARPHDSGAARSWQNVERKPTQAARGRVEENLTAGADKWLTKSTIGIISTASWFFFAKVSPGPPVEGLPPRRAFYYVGVLMVQIKY